MNRENAQHNIQKTTPSEIITDQQLTQFSRPNADGEDVLTRLQKMIAPQLHGLEDLKLAIAC